MAYQDTPNASKNNAFCWRTYEGQIDWKPRHGEASSAIRTQQIEAQRVAGVDPLFIPGMGSAVRQDPRFPTRLAISMPRGKR